MQYLVRPRLKKKLMERFLMIILQVNSDKEDAQSAMYQQGEKSAKGRGNVTIVRSGKKNKTRNDATNSVSDGGDGLVALNSYDNGEVSSKFFDNSNKVKVEIIPQVDNEMYSSSSSSTNTTYGLAAHNTSKSAEIWPSTHDDFRSGFRTIRSLEDVTTVSGNDGNSSDYMSVIRHSNDDYGSGNAYDKFISVHVKEEMADEEYDSEDTKSAASLTFKEEDEDKIVMIKEKKQLADIKNSLVLFSRIKFGLNLEFPLIEHRLLGYVLERSLYLRWLSLWYDLNTYSTNKKCC